MLESLEKEKKVIGTKQVRRAINNGEVKKIYIAQDADTRIINEIIELSENNSIEIMRVGNMRELGLACGIDVSAATVAILK